MALAKNHIDDATAKDVTAILNSLRSQVVGA
jgi:hypothetical protein